LIESCPIPCLPHVRCPSSVVSGPLSVTRRWTLLQPSVIPSEARNLAPVSRTPENWQPLVTRHLSLVTAFEERLPLLRARRGGEQAYADQADQRSRQRRKNHG